MEEELSAAIARFVIEAGGLEQGTYPTAQDKHPHPMLNPYFSKGGF